MMVVGPMFYALMANVAYTAGPVFDIVGYRAAPRGSLLRAGYIVSIALITLPGPWAVAAWLWTLATGKKLN